MTVEELTDLGRRVAHSALAVVISSLNGMLPEAQKDAAVETVGNVLQRAEVVFMSALTPDSDAALAGITRLRGGLLG